MINAVILDTSRIVKKMHDIARTMGVYNYITRSEFFMDDLLAALVGFLHQRNGAEGRVAQFAREIQLGQCHSHGGVVPAIFAPLISELGLEILRQLDSLEAYTLRGVLPYHYHLFPGKNTTSDIVLMRTHELTHATSLHPHGRPAAAL